MGKEKDGITQKQEEEEEVHFPSGKGFAPFSQAHYRGSSLQQKEEQGHYWEKGRESTALVTLVSQGLFSIVIGEPVPQPRLWADFKRNPPGDKKGVSKLGGIFEVHC